MKRIAVFGIILIPSLHQGGEIKQLCFHKKNTFNFSEVRVLMVGHFSPETINTENVLNIFQTSYKEISLWFPFFNNG